MARVSQGHNEIVVSGQDFQRKFCTIRGVIRSFVYNDVELLVTGPRLNIYRAPKASIGPIHRRDRLHTLPIVSQTDTTVRP